MLDLPRLPPDCDQFVDVPSVELMPDFAPGADPKRLGQGNRRTGPGIDRPPSLTELDRHLERHRVAANVTAWIIKGDHDVPPDRHAVAPQIVTDAILFEGEVLGKKVDVVSGLVYVFLQWVMVSFGNRKGFAGASARDRSASEDRPDQRSPSTHPHRRLLPVAHPAAAWINVVAVPQRHRTDCARRPSPAFERPIARHSSRTPGTQCGTRPLARPGFYNDFSWRARRGWWN